MMARDILDVLSGVKRFGDGHRRGADAIASATEAR